MKRAEFDTLWGSTIRNELEKLEGLRKEERNARIVGVVAGLAAGAATLLLIHAYGATPKSDLMEFAPFAAIIVGSLTYIVRKPAQYEEMYKQAVIDALSRVMRLSWRYVRAWQAPQAATALQKLALAWQQRSNPLENIYDESGLYGTAATMVTPGDIFVAEQAGHAMVEVKATRGSGKSKRTIFEGLVFRLNIGRAFAGETYIREEQWGDGNVGTSSTQGIRVTTLEWPEFEKLFEVETNNEVEAREILDPQFMAILHDWWQEHQTPVRLSFKHEYMYLSVPSADLFEPSPFSSVDAHKEELWGYLDVFRLAESLFVHIEHKYRLDLK